MFISSFELRARVRAFDTMVERADEVLQIPAVAEALGGVAVELADINKRVFLPNVHYGRASIPKSEEETDNPALLPITWFQRFTARDMVRAMSEPVKVWTVTDQLYADEYDIGRTTDELAALFDTSTSQQTARPAKRFQRCPQVYTYCQLDKLQDGIFTLKRPVMVVNNGLAKVDIMCEGVVIHEEIHVLDMMRYGPLMADRTFRVASEYRAYHTQTTIYDKTERPQADQGSPQVEAFRQKEADPKRPFHPTQTMIDMMTRTGRA